MAYIVLKLISSAKGEGDEESEVKEQNWGVKKLNYSSQNIAENINNFGAYDNRRTEKTTEEFNIFDFVIADLDDVISMLALKEVLLDGMLVIKSSIQYKTVPFAFSPLA